MDSERSPERLIKAGMAALQRQDYDHAIAAFQQLAKIAPTHRTKARMGLIQVLIAQGNTQKAAALCQPLLEDSRVAVRRWAAATLAALKPDSSAQTDSGFVPLEKPVAEKPVTEKPVSNQPPNQPPTEQTTATPTKEPSGPDESDTPDAPASIFHYRALNQPGKLAAAAAAQAAAPDGGNGVSVPEPQTRSQAPPPAPPAMPPPTSSPAEPDPELQWSTGTRLSSSRSLGRVSQRSLGLMLILTVPAVFLSLRWLIHSSLALVRNYLQFLDRLLPINIALSDIFWDDHSWPIALGLIIAALATPWLWPVLFTKASRLELKQLQNQSPEATALIQRLGRKRRWPQPQLYVIPEELPLIFSFGWHPRWGKLMLSQGLLEQLEADEIAAVVLYELGHWGRPDWVWLSLHGLLLQVLHRAYWQLATWGEARPLLVRAAAGIFANISYGLFWIFHQLGCGLARTRAPYRDRQAAEITGNPNGLARALGKLAQAAAAAQADRGYTPPLLESLDLLLPVAAAAWSGSPPPGLYWEAFNPLRHWLSVNQAHPPLGERLYTLMAYAHRWRLSPSLALKSQRSQGRPARLTSAQWRTLILQGGAWSGLVVGGVIGLLLWLVGAIALALNWPLLVWLYRDTSVLIGLPLIGAATLNLLRINGFFPDLPPSAALTPAAIDQWSSEISLLPLDSRPTKLTGMLTGRPALANWLGQEWRLQTKDSSLQLHHAGYLGPFSRSLEKYRHQPIQALGWFRRGYYPWMDLSQISTAKLGSSRSFVEAQHPVWNVVVSLVLLGCGLWILITGT